MKRMGFPIYLAISAAVLVLDQVTKYIIQSKMSLFEVIPVLPFFNIVYVDNTGSAFGMFKSLGNTFFIAVASLAMIVIIVLIIKYGEDRLPLALVLGGAAGNLMDRVTHGYVVDFLDFFVGRHHWPAFNVADSALTAGIAFLFIRTLFHGAGPAGRKE